MVQEEDNGLDLFAGIEQKVANGKAEDPGALLSFAINSEEIEEKNLLDSMQKLKKSVRESDAHSKYSTNGNLEEHANNREEESKSASTSWEEAEVGRFFTAYKECGMDWARISDTIGSREPEEVQTFYTRVKDYLSREDSSSPGLLEFLKSTIKVSESKTVDSTAQTPMQNGKSTHAAHESNVKMMWASSGKRSERKKRPAQQVRPAVSPDKVKSKSPDVLMTSVIETLAQAASVSRSNPGTPQSKLELQSSAKQKLGRNGVGKGNASPKPRKRLFADDGLAASALLGLASTSHESTGRPPKKGKTSRPSTPKSVPKKQLKNLMDNFRSQPLKELSGLAPSQVKVRNRRKPEYQKFPGPILPIMKLHKRFSAFKNSSPNAKVLERQLKLQSSLDGLLGWGEKTPAPPGTLLNKIQNCLSPSMRRWCYFEWFYSSIDKSWFEKNKFQEFLDHAGLSKCKKLQRAEWAMIRRSLGRPRRLSLQFLHEERAELEAYRAGVRKHFKDKGNAPSAEMMPRPLMVGQRVTARHPATGQIHDGSILTVDHSNSKYRVQFDRQELGVQQLEDIHIMARTSTETTPLVPIVRKKIGEPAIFTPTRRRQAGLPPTARQVPESHGMVTTFAPGPSDKEIDMRSLAEVDMLLDVKEKLLGLLRQMNDEAEGNLHLDENGCTSDQFQMQYALVIRHLRDANDKLKAALVQMQMNQCRLHNGSLQFVSVQNQNQNNSLALRVANDAKAKSTQILHSVNRMKEMKDKKVKDKKVKDLISNCITFMCALQTCADSCLPPDSINMALDMLLQQLKPQSEKNGFLYNEIKSATLCLLSLIKN